MSDVPTPLTDDEIAIQLADHPGWTRTGDEITRTFRLRYHGSVALIVHVADVERLIGHHADIDLRWDTIRFAITTHDAGHRLTAADFDLATRIDAIAAAHDATPV
ncbi:4a-hydroxytetrahydrobiopterin dehydratase [Pseudofrankia sp. BMG5.36]|uniref:4a-hydroxytetrahydrobiopterin dehydratase n=1 Tax=Pseudofrankia sp. BMG5.36 TaxID=1834512 RepID=UPI0008D963A8|nr:4a-hydroxytetrahydrobiopterin dehydratase [Pseudofrankia sp. BMG5.36]OHV69595.1 pterin-4-alpha-carbinolamine dehydratase [Pseudofrankia sp. BMG5.36]